MKIRRVVTGHNGEGQSCVKWDSELETALADGIFPGPGLGDEGTACTADRGRSRPMGIGHNHRQRLRLPHRPI